ncbi:PREDICTED: hemicentin-1-like [Amphimedon queenslandica]|uniref:Ig-like domain-containing protein n=1 Tax=Amphimedon queenslandica TaxID=400682 RepID=A0AAN0JK43_AMPQE|nr:PREDICTED: hemicentin-1-like [Amphimedon queenslandica]|eukprot:XP_019857137.1 PREDICTED: hemicentin-1-like [Amphimedon queenslandica]
MLRLAACSLFFWPRGRGTGDMWQLFFATVLTVLFHFGQCENYSLVVTPNVVVVQKTMDYVWLTCGKKTEEGHEENVERPACHHYLWCQIHWYKDERRLCNSAKYNMTKEKLRIGYPLTGVDSGVYSCACCFCTCTANLSASATLWVPPDVTASPNQSLTIGHTGVLSCNLSGIITKIFWYKNGRYITKWKTGARWKGNYFPYGNGSLAIRDVSLDSDGYYDCVAMNKAGKNSARIYIELKWPQSVAQKTSKCPKVLGPASEEAHFDRETREPRGLESKLVVQDIIAEEVYWTEEEKQRKIHSPVTLEVSHTCVSSESGERLYLDCRVVGYPVPIIYWSKAIAEEHSLKQRNHEVTDLKKLS